MNRMTRTILLSLGWTGAVLGAISPDKHVATVAAGCAALASLAAGASWLMKIKRDRMETLKMEQEYCANCEGQSEGGQCPLPKDLQPKTCPHKTRV